MVRVERHDHEHLVVAVGRRLHVGHEAVVVDRTEAQPVVGAECRIRPPDVVHARDERAQAAAPLEVPAPDLVLLARVVLLASGACARLAQLEGRAVDAVRRAERRREH